MQLISHTANFDHFNIRFGEVVISEIVILPKTPQFFVAKNHACSNRKHTAQRAAQHDEQPVHQ